MSKINFIYFDVGGVVILDFSKTELWQELLDDVVPSPADQPGFKTLFKEFEPRLCAGLSLDEFVNAAKQKFELNVADGQAFLNEFVSRFKPNLSLQPILTELAKTYRLGLLTNMYPGMLAAIQASPIWPKNSWEIIIDSSQVNVSKPDPKIYQLAELKTGLQPEQILFVENTLANLVPAQQRGWQTCLYDPAQLAESNQRLEQLCDLS